jgi:2-haloacid dehalogenase
MNDRAVAFDMYGTLVDPAGQADSLDEHVRDAAALARAWRRHQLEISWLLSLMGRYEDWGAVTAYALDAAIAEARLEPLEQNVRDVLLARARHPALYPDARGALERLQSAGFVLAVLSNGTAELLNGILADTGIGNYFADVISVDEVGRYKPAPIVYRHAARRLARRLEDIWLVSGNPFDAAGAAAVGMRVVKVDRAPSYTYGFARPPDAVVTTLAAVPAAIETASRLE